MRATRVIDRLQTEVSIVPPLLPDCHLPLSPSHTDEATTPSTATGQACVSVNNPPLCGCRGVDSGHLSAVGVIKFNESQHDGISSVCGAKVYGLFKC